MPTCKFYLEGMCSKEDCPYLHVKINPRAEVCLEFLKGYCKKGKEVCIICLVSIEIHKCKPSE